MGDYLREKYSKNLFKELVKDQNTEEDAKEILNIVSDVKKLMAKIDKKRTALKDVFVAKATEDILKEVKREHVSLKTFIDSGMYECLSSYNVDIHHPLSNEQETQEVTKLYHTLVKEDSDDVCTWTSDIFRDYSDSSTFFSIKHLKEEIKEALETDGSDYWEIAQFPQIYEMMYRAEEPELQTLDIENVVERQHG